MPTDTKTSGHERSSSMLLAALLLLAAAAQVSVEAVDGHGEAVLQLELGQRQLFVDERHVAVKSGEVISQFHRATKKGAVIRPYGSGNMSGSCQTRSMPQWNPTKQHYELPVLGGDPASQIHNLNGQSKAQWFHSKEGTQWSFGGISHVEYFYEPPYQAIIDTTDPDPSRLYKTVVPCAGPTPPAVCGPHTSADGINWTRVAGADKIPTSDEQNLSFDNKTGEFIYSVKRFGKHGRAVAVATTSNFSSSNWTDLGVVFEADEEDQRLGVLEIEARYNDSSLKRPFATPVPSVFNVDVYNMGVFKYESVYIGLPAMFHSVAPDSGNTDGFHLIKAVTSRDLQSWSWLGNRSTFITPSKVDSGAYDLMQMLPPSNVLVKGDSELWLYYTGLKTRASKTPASWKAANPDNGAICLATLRRDGFVSLLGGEGGGVVTTTLLRGWSAGHRLHVNADASVGKLAVELLHRNGSALSSHPYILQHTDAVRHHVQLEMLGQHREADDQAVGNGFYSSEPVRLRFSLSPGVHMYSYWLERS